MRQPWLASRSHIGRRQPIGFRLNGFASIDCSLAITGASSVVGVKELNGRRLLGLSEDVAVVFLRASIVVEAQGVTSGGGNPE